MKRWAGILFTSGIFAGLAGAQARQETCQPADKTDISALFDRWNNALMAGIPDKVVDLYAEDSVLLPTLSNDPRFTRAQKLDYFEHFLPKKPVGHIATEWIDVGCNTATDTGVYSFTLGDGDIVMARYTFTYRWKDNRWQISTHHSSRMPE